MKDKPAPKTPNRTVLCPKCRKRIFDVEGYAEKTVVVHIKCSHCKNIVSIKLPQAA